MARVSLAQMKDGQSGRVVELLGGCGFIAKLEALGVLVGKKIKKISTQFAKGPITVEVSGSKFAMGFGMASKIIVEVED